MSNNDIAVIGLSGLFPGSDSLDEFWKNLIDNKDCRSVATEKQMGRDAKAFLGEPGADDSFYCINGGYINDFSMDAKDINISEERLASLDDVYRWSLYVAREALKDSGYLNKVKNIKAGVILGNLSFPTKQSNQLFIPMYHKAINSALIDNLEQDDLVLPRYAHAEQVSKEAGLLGGYPAALIAEAFSLSASKFCLDAACASSIYSVKLACDYLLTGRSDLMLAGAVSAADPFFVNLGFSVFHAYPENQVSAPLDKRSQGLFAGEGAGMLVLKRLEDAIADGDNIKAIIKGGGLSNDGKGQHVLSPNTKGQVKAFERAYENANVDPASIDYIECHATGTPLGDKVELTSLESFFKTYVEKSAKDAPVIGSVKSNLGHLLTAAGMPAISKVIMAMDKGVIPASINIEQKQKSPQGLFSEEKICSENIQWEKENNEPRRAGVSVFGFGGANAHMVFEQAPAKAKSTSKKKIERTTKNLKSNKQQSMSIIGMDAHFGACENLAEFECLILEDRNIFRELPKNRWRGLEEEQIVKQAFGEKIPKGAYLESFDLDFLNFKLPPHMDERLIPQQLLLMKVVDNALKDAKIQTGGRVAVLVAMGTELELHQIRARVNLNAQFEEMWRNNPSTSQFSDEQKVEIEKLSKNSIHHKARLNQYTSAIGNIMASRISSIWDFSGPAFTVSAEENSVCQALELAQIMFEQGEADAVVVAAVDLSASVENLLLRQQFGAIHAEGASFSFDENNQGWCVGEGAGAIVLEKSGQNRRLADEKRIYAQIDALAFSQGVDAQALEAASKHALEQCDYKFKDLEYWELAASGFSAQDQGELDAILKLSQIKSQGERVSLAIGSAKNNIGHTFAASGIVSLMKAALCLHNRVIPGMSSWNSPKNKKADWQSSSLYIPTTAKTWFKDEASPVRHAAINSMGLDGRTCFVALSEDTNSTVRSNTYLAESHGQLFKFQEETEQALLSALELFSATSKSFNSLKDLANNHFWKNKNAKGNKTYVLVASDIKSLSLELELAVKGIIGANKSGKDWFSPSGSYYSPNALGKKGKLAFVYPGAFNSYLNIVKDLAQLFPELHNLFSDHSKQAATLFADKLYFPRSIEKLNSEQEKALQRALPDAAISSFENGISVSVALTEVLKNIFGVKPDSAFGYSMGEVSMLYALGVWGTTDAMSKRLRANPVFQTRLAGPMDTLRDAWNLKADVKDGSFWSGFALLAPVEKIKAAVAKEKFVRLILINTENEAVIAGKPEDCRRVAESLKCDFFEAALGDVIHCDWVRSDYDDLSALHILDVNKNNDVDFFTAVGNKKLGITSKGVANNIAEMYCNPVDFVTLTSKVYDDGAKIFVELGARDNCSRHISQILQDKEHTVVSLNRKGSSDKSNLLRALAKLVSHGVDVNLSRLYGKESEEINKRQLLVNIPVGGKRVFDEMAALKNIKSPVLAKPSITETKVTGSKITDTQVAISKVTEAKVEVALNAKFEKESVKVISDHENKKSRVIMNTIKHSVKSIQSTKISSNVIEGFHENVLRMSATHEAFLDSRKQSLKAVGDLIARQLSGDLPLSTTKQVFKGNNFKAVAVPARAVKGGAYQEYKIPNFEQSKVQYPNADLKNVIWGPQDLVEFAEGDIANVFGNEYKIIDSYSRRVRLPTTEYLLVDRVTKLNATVNKYEACSMTTEYDVPYDFWYSSRGQIPWAVAVESGQCDLLLIAYLGIDFQNKGERVYRLLDCELTFMDDVAMEGDTLRYDISINSYARSGDGFLFFFSYDCYVGNKLVLKMRNGAAGFFSNEELNAGKGVIETEKEKKARLAIIKQSFTPLLDCSKTQYDYQDMMALCNGDLAACFGEQYGQAAGRNQNLVYSAPKMLMIERITELDPKGGSWGLGLLVGEKTLDPEHWYFPCHFKDDQVMAGSLMSDGCSQLLRFYTWYLGLHTLTEDAVFQPMPGLGQQVRCRGQVVPQHGTLIYRMEITEIGTSPKPYAKANVDIILNGKIVVDFKNLGLFLGEITGTDLEKKINRRKRVLAGDYSNGIDGASVDSVQAIKPVEENKKNTSKVLHDGHVYVPGQYEIREHPFAPFSGNPNDINAVPDTLPFTQFHFIEFATGRIANCFGEKFGGIYDGRTPPRTPNADLQLTSRVLEIDGKRNELKRISSTLAEFDNPADAWYYTENTHPDLMPYSIIMEISLQPNGFISAWMGTTLMFPERDLYFRNLDGSGTLLKEVDLRGKTIRNRSTLLSTTAAGNTIIQSFKYDLSVDDEVFYEGTSVFGYFLKDALTHQLGLDKGRVAEPWHVEKNVANNLLKSVDLTSAEAKKTYYQGQSNKPYYHLANPKLDLIERVVLSSTAGEFNLGYVYAEKTINRNDWFFPCHFHQDPVMPGSLGVEAILQAMQLWALDNDLGKDFVSPRFIHELSTVKWKYRGQIIPDNKIMSLDVHISKVEKANEKVVIYANASLYKDGLRIYELADAQVALCEA